MKTSVTAIVMFVVAALFGAVGQYLYKTGAERASGGIASYLLNVPLIAGVVCYIVPPCAHTPYAQHTLHPPCAHTPYARPERSK